ncbi:hypothetical protein THASP1DRAFT_32876 [Thamnocephalis sphaerospora]|uniref:F-box domain-containing protein n=1 Tax=Thamnocephalis sphaerospora TaxID=78915 RepID=A0A4P9XI21_9FUNG|nr:hypothetical protein THASP1DRAFT_32876 [Thamnocephalis sphaerospora]|eukprot:RKP05286.1 hypothetical protein THASP1DRAFT_32876 [Thamnocephalis sphaerospora]
MDTLSAPQTPPTNGNGNGSEATGAGVGMLEGVLTAAATAVGSAPPAGASAAAGPLAVPMPGNAALATGMLAPQMPLAGGAAGSHQPLRPPTPPGLSTPTGVAADVHQTGAVNTSPAASPTPPHSALPGYANMSAAGGYPMYAHEQASYAPIAGYPGHTTHPFVYGYDPAVSAASLGTAYDPAGIPSRTVLTPTASVTTVVTTKTTVITAYPPLLFRPPSATTSTTRNGRGDPRRFPLADVPTPPALKRFAVELMSGDGQGRPGYDRASEGGKMVTIQFQEEQVNGASGSPPTSVLSGTDVAAGHYQPSPGSARKRRAPNGSSNPMFDVRSISSNGAQSPVSRLSQHAQYLSAASTSPSGTVAQQQYGGCAGSSGEPGQQVHGHVQTNVQRSGNVYDDLGVTRGSSAGASAHMRHRPKRRHLDRVGYPSSSSASSSMVPSGMSSGAAETGIGGCNSATPSISASHARRSSDDAIAVPLSVSLSAASASAMSDTSIGGSAGIFGDVDPATLPSPTMSPITRLDSAGQPGTGGAASYFTSSASGPLTPNAAHSPPTGVFPTSAPTRTNALVPTAAHQPNLMDLPAITRVYDAMPESLQTYLLFQLLRRTSLPSLQFVCSYTQQHIRRDFIAELPSELSLHVASFLNVRSLCRAAQVSKRWREIVDGESSLWRRRLLVDGLCDNDAEVDGNLQRDLAPWEQPGYWYMGGGNSRQIMAELTAREASANESQGASSQAGSSEQAQSLAWNQQTQRPVAHVVPPQNDVLAPTAPLPPTLPQTVANANPAEAVPAQPQQPQNQPAAAVAATATAATTAATTANAPASQPEAPAAATEDGPAHSARQQPLTPAVLRARYASALAAAAGHTGLPPLPSVGDEEEPFAEEDESEYSDMDNNNNDEEEDEDEDELVDGDSTVKGKAAAQSKGAAAKQRRQDGEEEPPRQQRRGR